MITKIFRILFVFLTFLFLLSACGQPIENYESSQSQLTQSQDERVTIELFRERYDDVRAVTFFRITDHQNHIICWARTADGESISCVKITE